MKNKTLQNCSISYHFLFNDQTFIDKHSSGFFFLIYIKLIVTIFSNIETISSFLKISIFWILHQDMFAFRFIETLDKLDNTRFKSDNFKILARQCILCQQIINVIRRSLFSENMKSLKYKLIITFKGVTTSLVPYMYFSLLNSKNRLKLFVASM